MHLPIAEYDEELEDLITDLFYEYAGALKMDFPYSPEEELGQERIDSRDGGGAGAGGEEEEGLLGFSMICGARFGDVPSRRIFRPTMAASSMECVTMIRVKFCSSQSSIVSF